MKTAIWVLAIALCCVSIALVEEDETALAQSYGGYSSSSSNPMADFQKWVQENQPKVVADIQKAHREGKPFEAQRIEAKWRYDHAMKNIDAQEKVFEQQTGKRR